MTDLFIFRPWPQEWFPCSTPSPFLPVLSPLISLIGKLPSYYKPGSSYRLSWLISSALVFEPKCGGRGGVAGPQPMNTAVHRSPNKLWRSNSVFNLCFKLVIFTNISCIVHRKGFYISHSWSPEHIIHTEGKSRNRRWGRGLRGGGEVG